MLQHQGVGLSARYQRSGIKTSNVERRSATDAEHKDGAHWDERPVLNEGDSEAMTTQSDLDSDHYEKIAVPRQYVAHEHDMRLRRPSNRRHRMLGSDDGHGFDHARSTLLSFSSEQIDGNQLLSTATLRTSKSPPRSPPIFSPLSDKSQEFAQIRVHDFETCMKYVDKHPDVLDESPQAFIQAAIEACQHVENSRADRLIARAVMLRHCQKEKLSVREMLYYLRDLHEGTTKAYAAYERKCRKLHDYCMTEANLTLPSTVLKQQDFEPTQLATSQSQSDLLQQEFPWHNVFRNAPDQHASISDPRPTSNSKHSAALPHRSISHPENEELSLQAVTNIASRTASSKSTLAEQLTTLRLGDTHPSSVTAGLPIAVNSTANLTTELGHHATSNLIHHTTEMNTSVNPVQRPSFETGTALARSLSPLPKLQTIRTAEYQPQYTAVGQVDGEFFEARKQDARNFFRIGRVFRMWWHQSVGAFNSYPQDPRIRFLSDGLMVYSKVQWMVTVLNKQGYCICCPVGTYSGRGVSKPGLTDAQTQAHAIVYSEGSHPKSLEGEPPMEKEPICVRTARGGEQIHHAARIHFGQCHTVNWDAHIQDMGRVIVGDREKLYNYFVMENTR